MSYYELWTWDKYIYELRELFIMVNNNIPNNIDYKYYLDNVESDLTINIKIILHFINLHGHNLETIQNIFDEFLCVDNTTIKSPLYFLYYLFLYHKTSKKSLTYYNIVSNYNNMKSIFEKIFNEFKKCGVLFDINDLLNKLTFIDNKSYYQYNITFSFEIEKSKIIAIIIDLISEYFINDNNIFINIIPNVFNSHDNTNGNFTYREHLLRNIKAHSKFLQKDIVNPIINNNIIFNNWDHFFHIINNNIFQSFIDNNILTNILNDGLYDIIEYNIEVRKFDVQEGFDKFMLVFSNIADKNYILKKINILYNDEILLYLRNLYTKIIKLFKDKGTKPYIETIFEKISLIHNDDDIIKSHYDVKLGIDDEFVSDKIQGDCDFTHYQNRGLLLDVIYETYIDDYNQWNEIISQINIFNINDNNDYKYIIDIIGDYYRYDLITDVKSYGKWENISAIEHPKSILKFGGGLTYKNLRYMRLKYYSEFLKSL